MVLLPRSLYNCPIVRALRLGSVLVPDHDLGFEHVLAQCEDM